MRLNLILTGLILGAIGGFFIGQIGSDVLLRIIEDRTGQLIIFCILGIALITAAFLVSDRIIKILTGARNTQIITWFEETSQHVANTLPINPEAREALKVKAQDAFAIYISWRVRATLFGMLIAIVVVIVGSISTHVTLEQNRKLERQNELLDSQNQSVRMQILLSETERLGKNRSKAEEQVRLITQEARRLRRLGSVDKQDSQIS